MQNRFYNSLGKGRMLQPTRTWKMPLVDYRNIRDSVSRIPFGHNASHHIDWGGLSMLHGGVAMTADNPYYCLYFFAGGI